MVVALALGGVAGAAAPPAPDKGKPNIVFFLIDNVSWGSFGVYGGPIPTPRVDALAKQGIRFTNYNVEVQCTPSRAAILTGRHPVRSGTYKVPLPGEGGKAGLAPWEYTIGELLSDAGYATALYGKWHVGNTPGRFPNDQGFDEWWGIPNSWDESGYTAWPQFKESGLPAPMILEGKKGQATKPVMPLDLKVRPIVDEKYIIPKTIDFIKREAAAKKPFFVYIGYSELHEPIMPNPTFAKSTKTDERIAECIKEMDYRAGQVLDAVKEAGVEDTIFIFSSDNADGGATPQDGPNFPGPWRGNFFYTPFEGSMRVPAMIRWPGKVPAGVVSDEILAAVDWLPTLAGMVGASSRVPKDRPIDGVDASAFMLGKSKTTGRDTYMFFGADGELMSVKWKNFQTVMRYTDNNPPASPAIQSGYIKPTLPMMYDLSKDPHQDSNLWYTNLTNGWVLAPTLKPVEAYEASLKKYPNIKVGEDFKGYKKGATPSASSTPGHRSGSVGTSASNAP